MDPLNIVTRTKNPEAVVQKKIIEFLTQRGWTVMPTHGNAHQKGFPDLYCVHPDYGQRWVEVKYLESFSFTPSQIKFFPKINAAGIGIWILTDATIAEYHKLFERKHMPNGNWIEYVNARQMLGAKVFAHQVVPSKVKCVCGFTYELRPSEKVICICTRTVRGK
jgi:hypothetical protein